MQGYCFKCKTTREIVQATETPQRNGAVRIQGRCDVCRGKVSTLRKA